MTNLVTKIISQEGPTHLTERRRELYVIAGMTGALGAAYHSALKTLPNAAVLGLYRTPSELVQKPAHQLDLLHETKCKEVIDSLDLKPYDRLTYIHPVGAFRFENSSLLQDLDGDGIDDFIYRSNVNTFTNVAGPLIQRITDNQKITLVGFGSVSDKYNVPYWGSYTESKNILRDIIRRKSRQDPYINGLFVNVSTVDTGNENKLRPHPADKDHWLKVEEIVEATMPQIQFPASYTEIDVYRESPHFTDEFYTNHQSLLKRWNEQMGLA